MNLFELLVCLAITCVVLASLWAGYRFQAEEQQCELEALEVLRAERALSRLVASDREAFSQRLDSGLADAAGMVRLPCEVLAAGGAEWLSASHEGEAQDAFALSCRKRSDRLECLLVRKRWYAGTMRDAARLGRVLKSLRLRLEEGVHESRRAGILRDGVFVPDWTPRSLVAAQDTPALSAAMYPALFCTYYE